MLDLLSSKVTLFYWYGGRSAVETIFSFDFVLFIRCSVRLYITTGKVCVQLIYSFRSHRKDPTARNIPEPLLSLPICIRLVDEFSQMQHCTLLQIFLCEIELRIAQESTLYPSESDIACEYRRKEGERKAEPVRNGYSWD